MEKLDVEHNKGHRRHQGLCGPCQKRIHKDIKDLMSMDVILKQADKHIGILHIRGDI